MNTFTDPVKFVLFLMYLGAIAWHGYHSCKAYQQIQKIKSYPSKHPRTDPNCFVSAELYSNFGMYLFMMGFWMFITYMYFLKDYFN